MGASERLDRLHLHPDPPLHDQVCLERPNLGPTIENLDGLLLDERHLGIAELEGQGILVDLLKKPRAQFLGHLEATANDQSGMELD